MTRLADFIHHEHNTLRPHVELIPHAREERDILYRTVEQATQAPGSTATMNREHLEAPRRSEPPVPTTESPVPGVPSSLPPATSLPRPIVTIPRPGNRPQPTPSTTTTTPTTTTVAPQPTPSPRPTPGPPATSRGKRG